MSRRRNTNQSKSTPFYKEGWFIGLTSVLGVAATVVGIWKSVYTPTPPVDVYENVEFVLDTSAGMNDPFDGTTKLKVAGEAVGTVLRQQGIERENLAFRLFGGPCAAAATEPTLAFSTQNEELITKTIPELSAHGQAPLVRAVLQAITDFGDLTRFKDKGKRIIVITGTTPQDGKKDPCGMSVEQIQQKLDNQYKKGELISFDFHFIGVGLDEAGKTYLANFAGQIGGRADFADNRRQLEDILTGVVGANNREQPQVSPGSQMERESVGQNGKAIADNLNATVNRLNLAASYVNQRDCDAAARELEQARAVFRESSTAFEQLARIEKSEQYHRIYETASSNRKILEQMISLMEQILVESRTTKCVPSEATRTRYATLQADYNRRKDELNEQLKQLAGG